MSQSAQPPDKLRAAVAVLTRARESMLDQMADTVLAMADEFDEGGFQINEFLELNGSRLHFLCLLIGQLELLGEMRAMDAPPAEKKEKRPRRREEPKTTGGDESASTHGEEAGNDT